MIIFKADKYHNITKFWILCKYNFMNLFYVALCTLKLVSFQLLKCRLSIIECIQIMNWSLSLHCHDQGGFTEAISTPWKTMEVTIPQLIASKCILNSASLWLNPKSAGVIPRPLHLRDSMTEWKLGKKERMP